MRPRWPQVLFMVAAGFAGLAPLVLEGPAKSGGLADRSFPGWPERFEGRALTALALSDREAAFARDFPGETGRFHDGQREVIVRYVTAATRRLHPAADCLRGVGFKITPLPGRWEASGALMSCLRADRKGQSLRVCEGVRAAIGSETWPDVAAWYWAATLTGAAGPWWSFVVSENIEDGRP